MFSGNNLRDPCPDCRAEYGSSVMNCSEPCEEKKEYEARLRENLRA